MPGNYWKKPHGLHPTPSACFPPKCKKKGITGTLRVVPATLLFGDEATYEYTINFPEWPEGTPIGITWLHPGLTTPGTPVIGNGLWEFVNTSAASEEGLWTIVAHFEAPDGSTHDLRTKIEVFIM